MTRVRVSSSRLATALRAAGMTAIMMFLPICVQAAELVVFETSGCPYCEAWNREVGRIYDLTDDARLLPLRRVDISGPRPPDLARIADIRYTPTFIVMVGGREAGRIVGYNGEDQFWGLLGEILAALPRAVN